ncbi:39S ribosomal protein L30, mitochondrial [Harpegnathos saltator]|uniref:Large ribosomal subunit protein uL30m n=1 Tax=Harpegnathos saltator TaxID=610380 RepID=E2B2B3_HARSA|nr:39S ribosomal protein L30, mitochondrial [Harpegnathos saltator]EFN90150.1 39S ribosomal protein L30, mitochondrial [Harpegnathos saltator]
MTSRMKVFWTFVRHYAAPKSWKPDGVKYGYVTYYPKSPNHVDPSITPSKLLMVTLVKPYMGNPYYLKDILTKQLRLKERGREPVIVKNTPENCALLWKVKHLVKIVPIKLPEKLPTADDLNGTYLHENGTFYVIPKVDPARYEATEEYINDPKKLNRNLISEKLRLKWLSQ